MCDQLPCINMAVTMVAQLWPEVMFTGIAAHRRTNGSPPFGSRPKTMEFTTMMQIVTMGKCTGRRDASVNGIRPPTLAYLQLRSADEVRGTHIIQGLRIQVFRWFFTRTEINGGSLHQRKKAESLSASPPPS